MSDQPDTSPLNLTVTDFGPIVEANVDLRPLTVFVGPSNTGKSYLAILIYAAHRFFGRVGVARRRRAGSFISQLGSAQRSTDPLSEESIETLAGWAAALSPSLDRDQDRIVGEILPESVAALVRSRLHSLQDIDNAKKDLDLEIMRCFGLDAIEGLVRRPCRGTARVRLQRHVANDPPFEQAFTVPAVNGSFRVSLPDEIPLGLVDMPAGFIRDVLEALNAHSWSREDSWHPMDDLVDILSVFAMQYALGPTNRPVHYLPADRTGIMHAHRVSSALSSVARRAPASGRTAHCRRCPACSPTSWSSSSSWVARDNAPLDSAPSPRVSSARFSEARCEAAVPRPATRRFYIDRTSGRTIELLKCGASLNEALRRSRMQ